MNEDKVLNLADQIAEEVTRSHFHNQGLLDDQVDSREWGNYFDNVRNAILDAALRWSD